MGQRGLAVQLVPVFAFSTSIVIGAVRHTAPIKI